MSKGVFTILSSNKGKHDQFLTSTDMLRKRLDKILRDNMESGLFENKQEAKASMADVQRTHNLFVKNSFKPHVALAYEYFKTQKEGSGIVGILDSTDHVKFSLKGNNGNFLNDMVVHVVFDDIGNPNADPATYPKYRYCEFPGLRLFQKVMLTADHLEVDSYNTEDAVLYTKIKVSASRTPGWYEMLGQENEVTGEYYRDDLSINEMYKFKDGAQTPKPFQKGLELWVPLIFDFNEYVGRSLHNSLINTDQKYIEIDISAMNKIMKAIDSTGATIPDGINGFKIKSMALYSRNVYLPPEINDIFTDRSDLQLIRVKRQHRKIITESSGNIELRQLKYPIEIIYFGFRPLVNGDNANPYSFNDWHKMTYKTRKNAPITVLVPNAKVAPAMQLVRRCVSYANSTPPMELIGFTAHGNVLYPLMPEAFFNNYLPYILPGLSTPGEQGVYVVPWCHYPILYDPSGHINNSTARELFIAFKRNDVIATTLPDPSVEMFTSAQCINFLIYDKTSIRLKYVT